MSEPLCRNSVDLPSLLKAAKEEKFILHDRPTQHPAELVLIQHLLFPAAVTILEEAVGIERRIAEELEQRSMECIAPGFGNHVHVGAGVPPVAGVFAEDNPPWAEVFKEITSDSDRYPEFLPDGRHFLYMSRGGPESSARRSRPAGLWRYQGSGEWHSGAAMPGPELR